MSADALPAELPAILGEGVELLRAIAGDPTREAELVAAFRARHGAFRATLLVDRPPGSPRAERDLHLEHDEIGGLSLAWREQDGAPWALLYADHWAAPFVMSVDDRPVTIRKALLTLRLDGSESADVLRTLVDNELVEHAIFTMDPPVNLDEALVEVDRLRRRLGFHQRDRLLAWLGETGLSEEDLVEIGRAHARRRRWAEALTEGRVAARFAQSPTDFDRVTVVEVAAWPASRAEEIAEEIRAGASLASVLERLPAGASMTVRRGFAFESEADAPDPGSGRVRVVMDRRTGELDTGSEAAVRALLVQEWLDEQRAAARIRWYWP